MTPGELHPRRMAILRYLSRLEVGERPSVAEIALAAGVRSTQTAHYHLMVLEREGYIERGRVPAHQRRPVRLTGRGWEAVGSVPLLGRIAAGRGLEAVPVEGESFSLPAGLLYSGSGRRRYVLRVVGQSMTRARIEDGDLLVVEENEDPADGSVVVALLNNGEEVTVKRLYREGNKVRLVPENGGHEEIMIPAEEVRIQGEVIFVVHPPRR